ncbi:MAG: DNA polymerase III subunit [Dehalococcoidales bacterium]|jgi:DNA polymerase-3 subunit delta'
MWEVIGQTRAVSLLQHGLESGKLAHAYLLTGPEHVGKMTLARNLAQALNCEAAERPCLKCPSCEKIAAMRHADVQVIGLIKNGDAAEAKLISIDQIKEMQHAANLPPFEGKHKVFIIDNAELLSLEAANRLLKTLEEPVDNITFVLLTVNDKLLPLTVISRCQRLELAPMPLAAETAALIEKNGLEPQRARLLAGLSHGCPEWAIAAAKDDRLMQQRDEELDKILGAIRADYEARFAYAAQLAARFSQDRGAVYRSLDFWRDYWRDLMLQKLGCDDMIVNIDRKAELEEMARGYRLGQIKTFIGAIQSAAEQLRQNANTRLALEVLMLDIPSREGGSVPV